MKCVNCGKEIKVQMNTGFLSFSICKKCDNARRQMSNMFRQGVELEYGDGTKETVSMKR